MEPAVAFSVHLCGSFVWCPAVEPGLAQARGLHGASIAGRANWAQKRPHPAALTSNQRRRAILRETTPWAQRRLLEPAVSSVLEFCRPRLISAHHVAWSSAAAGAVAGSLLIFSGGSPLFRFWAGVFLWAALVLDRAAVDQREHAGIPVSTETNIWRFSGIAGVAALIIVGCIGTAALIAGSGWFCLAAIAAGVSAAVQMTTYDRAWRQYAHAAGAGIPAQGERLFELSLRRRDAELRECSSEARFWHAYAHFRRAQELFISGNPVGSADAFWHYNRWRMVLWTLFAPATICVALSASLTLSAFWPAALDAYFLLLAVAGNLLLLFLLNLRWKTQPVGD
jgi:hypothetical protein